MIDFNCDEKYMQRCLQLAACGMETGSNPKVGAVIVVGDRIIGEGYHARYGNPHAEVNAFNSISKSDESLCNQATLYVSLEPCSHYGKTPPCADLIISKSVKRVVVGCIDPFSKVSGRGIQRLIDAGISVTTGVLEDECKEINRYFMTFHRLQRPYITLKWAQSADGFIDNNFSCATISTPFTQILVHKLRAESGAILVGRTTYERDNPRLDVRKWAGNNPERIILGNGRTIESILNDLYERSILSLLVEGGLSTLMSFINSNLWDEIRVERSLQIFGRGTMAPELPKDARVYSKAQYDNNVITIYRK